MIRTILRDIWKSRELFIQLTQRDLKLRYRQAVMGFAWALFMPVLTISAGIVLRTAVSSGGGDMAAPSLGGIAIKSWAWAFFAGAMNFATVSLLTNASLVTKIYFPREVLPLASIVAQGVDSLIGFTTLMLVGYWMGFHWSLQLLWVPLLIMLLLLLTTGLAFLFACANLFFRDVKYILQVLLTFGIFFTPVFMEPAMYKKYAPIMMLNPLSPILEGLRLTMVEHTSLLQTITSPQGYLVWSPWLLVYAVVVGVGATLLGMVAFRKSAAYFAEYY